MTSSVVVGSAIQAINVILVLISERSLFIWQRETSGETLKLNEEKAIR